MFTPADPGNDATALLHQKIAEAIQRHGGDADRAARELVHEFQMRATHLGAYHEDSGPRAVYSFVGGFTD